MAKQTSSSDSSLPLHEVLEAEFVALHGELPSDYPSSSEPKTRLKALWDAIHGQKEKRAALCISGGGIRSAIFGLGILQGLARCGLLDKFHYLSTVSGGGYIGSWLSAWIKNHPQGASGVAVELKRHRESTLDPEPQPIRHLREFSNYLAPRTGLTSVDFWTLIATFVRNMFLNWLVLISLLATALMIPRLCLTPINLHPSLNNWTDAVTHSWDMGLKILLVVGLALIAVAMAYAFIDVPSTGNARLPQRRFLLYRQLPLLVASVILAAWWAVFWNIHFGDPFPAKVWLVKFLVFFAGSYICGGLLGWAVRSFRKGEQKARSGGRWRLLAIVVTTALGGFSLWVMATQLFLGPSKIEFTLKRDCEATDIPSQQARTMQQGTKGQIKPDIYIVKTDQGLASIARKDHDAFELNRVPNPKTNWTAFALNRDCEATKIASGQKTKILKGTTGEIMQTDEGNDIVETDQGLASIGYNDLDALEPKPVPLPAKHALNYFCFAPALILAVVMLVNFLFAGLTSWVSEDEDREWWGRSAAWILITIFGWVAINVIVLWGGQAISATANQLNVFLAKDGVEASKTAKALLGSFGGVTGIAGALLALRSKLSNKLAQKGGFQWLLVVVAIVFFVLLAVVISWVLLLLCSLAFMKNATRWLSVQHHIIDNWGVAFFIVSLSFTGVILLFGIVMGRFINANKFSLHATYRNRLIRAFLAASRTSRKPHLFSGFDPDDNIKLGDLSSDKPLHVVNGALNLVKGEQLAWQERKAESFTMSRLHCGSWNERVGYRPSAEYGDGITLGTAMAISGAAANPNMGYHSSPAVGLLMTLFNVRLGWWLGNPGPRGAKTWRRSGPTYSVGPLFSEAFGLTTDRYKYVNLSDGGHFENLGLYEMVLRRCHYIIVSDGGQDPECSYADLGEAVRKIRIDFGIPIEFGPMSIYPRSAIDTLKTPGHNCAIGRIRYSVVDGDNARDGIIVYIKPACYGDEPRDIYEYFKTNPTFPHESTSDQFFSESQFESYRMLGAYTMGKLCADCQGDFDSFIRYILKHHLDIEAPDWLSVLREAQGNPNKPA